MTKIFWTAAFVFLCAGFAAAQPAPSQRIAGTIERTTPHSIIVRPLASGDALEVFVTDKIAVFDVSKATIADIKPGAFIGVGATPQTDGSQRAVQVTVMAESQRELGEGHRPWDRAPNGTMTNGAVDTIVGSIDGPVLTVKYRGGEKKIIVPPDATILAYSSGDRSELKAGAHVAILGAKKRPDGMLETDRINVGRGGVEPR